MSLGGIDTSQTAQNASRLFLTVIPPFCILATSIYIEGLVYTLSLIGGTKKAVEESRVYFRKRG